MGMARPLVIQFPTSSGRPRTVLRTLYPLLCAILTFGLTGAAIWGATSTGAPVELLGSALGAALLARAPFVRVQIRSDRIVIHAWFRNVEIPHKQPGSFEMAQYSGF